MEKEKHDTHEWLACNSRLLMCSNITENMFHFIRLYRIDLRCGRKTSAIAEKFKENRAFYLSPQKIDLTLFSFITHKDFFRLVIICFENDMIN